MLFDLHGMDERLRTHRDGLPAADFSRFLSPDLHRSSRDIMLAVALSENDSSPTFITKLFPNANWYERETGNVWHYLRWSPEPASHHDAADLEGHPLRKDYPARATEFDPFELTKAKQDLEMEALTFKPEEWGMKRGTDNEDFMFSLTSVRTIHRRMVRSALFLQLTVKRHRRLRTDIGYHHRGAAEKYGRASSPAQLHPVYRPY
ncbi:NADH-quinone oxidoreductase subunit C [Klebsiella pneumoniae]|nr:NADH-quinone oxidoreductase subunit C [Klebsiella pneumoniae]